jgi:hypothetical protein
MMPKSSKDLQSVKAMQITNVEIREKIPLRTMKNFMKKQCRFTTQMLVNSGQSKNDQSPQSPKDLQIKDFKLN